MAQLSRSTFYYRQKAASRPDRHAALKEKIRAIFDSHKGRYGYRRIMALLRRAGWTVNKKRVERIWRCEGLKIPAKQPKRGATVAQRRFVHPATAGAAQPCLVL